jgi:tetratricopeptide (TPR) repeat protein
VVSPSSLRSTITKAKKAQSIGDVKQAEQALLDALSNGGEQYADIHHQLGVLLHTRGDFARACHHFETALELNPGYTEAALDLAIVYNDLGRYSEAKALLHQNNSRQDSKTDPLTQGKIANLHAEVGDAYRSAGLPKEAVLEFRRALGLAPDFVDIRTRLAKALTDAGECEEAAEQLRLILDERPNYTQAALQLALLAISSGDQEEAKLILAQILEQQPDHQRANAYMRMLEHNTQAE